MDKITIKKNNEERKEQKKSFIRTYDTQNIIKNIKHGALHVVLN